MPVHDWTRVSAGTFHHFHTNWITELGKALNSGLLPEEYYALVEQAAGSVGPDVLTLASRRTAPGREANLPAGIATLEEAPPRVRFISPADEEELYALKRRRLAIRHASGDAVVAMIEIVSPGNKRGQAAFQRFIDKATSVLNYGCHLLILDLFPPGRFDPQGIHGALWSEYSHEPFVLPPDRPLTLAAYSAGLLPTAYVEPTAVDQSLPDMPLFLEEDLYLNVPLESTYMEAYRGVPARWRP